MWKIVVLLAIAVGGQASMKERPKIGVCVAVVQDGAVLLGKRKNSHGEGAWSFPGGHLEFGESIEECARRELEEETNLKASSLRIGSWVSNIMDGTKHYITFIVHVDRFEGDLQLLEPGKCEGWEWFKTDQLPSPLFPSVHSLFYEKKLDPTNAVLEKLLDFYHQRDWEQFHSPKNVVMDLAAEVGELVDPFRWLTEEQSYHLDEKTLAQVRDEIGDVFKAILYLSHKLGIDPVEATYEKIKKMDRKYPATACRGKAGKYTAYE